MNLPPVSYFIPSYNCANTVREAVESILNGNFIEGDEILLTNDGSTDNTAEVLSDLSIEYPFLRIYHNEFNRGGSATRNICVRQAKHDLLFCLDSDNILIPNTMKALRTYYIEQKADAASFQEQRYFSKTPNIIDYIWRFRTETSLADFLADHRNPGSSGNYLYSRKSWLQAGGYPEFAGALDTWGFGFYQLATGSKMVALPDSGYWHRYGGQSYYIRDMNKKNMSLAALQVLLPYLHLINPDDVDYIMSRKARYEWLEKLVEKPLRTAEGLTGDNAEHINPNAKFVKPGIIHRILRKLDRSLPENY
jgi:glycosyltransferase involved in cell wall biosynthesis